jgi:hypothetical protein
MVSSGWFLAPNFQGYPAEAINLLCFNDLTPKNGTARSFPDFGKAIARIRVAKKVLRFPARRKRAVRAMANSGQKS